MRRGTSGLNLLLGVNKPSGMSSHDVVNRVRRVLGERRVGHAGTLDPLATGVLVVGVGQGTRLMGYLTADTKSYLSTICFGAQTSTDDAEGEVVRTAPVGGELMEADFAKVTLAGLLGEQMQTPPAYSAISVDGKRAYAKARAGEQVELEPRRIEVLEAELISIERDGDRVLWNCAFTVSKGTYIRALARDLGASVGSAAYLLQLCRTSSGKVTLASCVSLEELGELGPAGVHAKVLDPADALGIPVYRVTDRERQHVEAGRAMAPARAHQDGLCAIVADDRLLGIWEVQNQRMRPRVNFPQGIEGVRG